MPPPSQLKRNQITTVGRLLMVIVALFGSASLAQTLCDAEIQAAINRGRSTPPKVLWQELRKKETLITRGDFGKPVELRVAFLTDSDRIAIQVLYAQHELREFSVDDAKKQLLRRHDVGQIARSAQSRQNTWRFRVVNTESRLEAEQLPEATFVARLRIWEVEPDLPEKNAVVCRNIRTGTNSD